MIQLDSLQLPGIRHAFFTRRGGVSTGLYGSLNCGLGSGDDRAAVAANRARAMAALDLRPAALATCHQYHSAEVLVIEDADPGDGENPRRADAMVTARRGIALGILTADCAPLLFVAAEDGVVGAAHAGWRGALAGVAEATVGAMARLGARTGNITAAIGPCIGRHSYEVGPEFPAPFLEQCRENALYFSPARREGHFMFDLSGYLAGRLARLGLAEIHRVDRDTKAESVDFFSYRRSRLRGEPDFGRLLSAVALAA